MSKGLVRIRHHLQAHLDILHGSAELLTCELCQLPAGHTLGLAITSGHELMPPRRKSFKRAPEMHDTLRRSRLLAAFHIFSCVGFNFIQSSSQDNDQQLRSLA